MGKETTENKVVSYSFLQGLVAYVADELNYVNPGIVLLRISDR